MLEPCHGRWNRARYYGGGAATDATLGVVDSEINGCEAQAGGGIYNAGGTLIMSGSLIANNQATNFGGGVMSSGDTLIRFSNFTNNNGSAFGGAFAALDGDSTIE